MLLCFIFLFLFFCLFGFIFLTMVFLTFSSFKESAPQTKQNKTKQKTSQLYLEMTLGNHVLSV